MPALSHDSIDPLDSLESQIEELERKILGNSDISEKDVPVVDSLIQSSNLINNAVYNHDSICNIFDRLNQLGKFLDPSFEDSLIDVACKTKIVLESENELREYLLQSRKLSELNNTLTGESFKKVPTLIDNLHRVLENTVKTQNEYNCLIEKIKEVTENYCSVIRILSRSFLFFETQLAIIEENRKMKKVVDE